MRVDHLRYLIEIDKHRSISAAAKELFLGQTTLSAIVKNIEEEIGITIFEITHKGVITTPEGEQAMALILDICFRFEEIKELGAQIASLAHSVTITTSPTINSGLALPVNKLFLEALPEGNLEFQIVAGEEVGPMLIRNDSNIGVTYLNDEDLANYRIIASRYQIKTKVLYTDYLYLLVPQNHPLAENDRVSYEDLDDLRFAMLAHYNSSENFLAFPKFLGAKNQYFTFPNINLIKQAVATQNMVAMLMGFAIYSNYKTENAGLKVLNLRNNNISNKINLCLIHRAECNLRQQEKLVINCIKAFFGNLPSPKFSPESD